VRIIEYLRLNQQAKELCETTHYRSSRRNATLAGFLLRVCITTISRHDHPLLKGVQAGGTVLLILLFSSHGRFLLRVCIVVCINAKEKTFSSLLLQKRNRAQQIWCHCKLNKKGKVAKQI
jgi:hypothetical protein